MSNSVNLSLDVTKTGIQNPLIKVRQGDGGFETLRTTVTANGEPMDLQGWTITFMGTTAGNHKIVDGNVTLIEAPNGIFDYTPSKAWGMDIGDFKIAYFKFVKGDGSASSANFRVSVIEAVDLMQEEAQNYISVVDTTIAEINQHLTDSLAHVTQSIADANNNANAVASNVTSLGNRVDDYNNKLAAVQVGGRNLLLNTARTTSAVGNNKVNGNFDAQGGIYYLAGNQKASDIYKQYGSSGYLTLSFDWIASGSNISGSFIPQWNDVPWGGGFLLTDSIKPSTTNTSGHFVYTVKLDISGYSTGTATAIKFRQDNLQGNITISNMKLESGNVATDWTPAPEDAPRNDAQLVHKTGTETIAGDKTFTSTINGNAATATKWQTARTLALTGDVTGSVSMDGSNNVSIATTGADLVHKSGDENINGLKSFEKTPVYLDDNSAVIEDTYTRITVVKVRGVVSVSVAVKAVTPNNGNYYVDLPVWANGNALYATTWIYLSTALSDSRWNVSVRINSGTNNATRIAFSANTPVGFAYTTYSA